jgi:hypothetical protein
VANAGAIDLHAAANGASLAIGAAGVTLSGGGTILLSETRQRAAQIYGGHAAKLINVDNTIEGAGVIGLGGMTLVNDTHGVIDATSASMGLYIEAGAVTNAGLIEATGNGKLIISGTISNHLHGVIEAGSGAYVDLSYADIMGGTLIKSGTGLLVARNTVLDGTQSPVVIVGMLDSFNLTLRGAINNNGIVTLNDQGRIDANVTLSGGGTMTSGDFYGGAAGVTVFNVDNTITGYGIGGGGMTFVNEAKGVIDSGDMVINMQGQTLINAGLVEATGRGRFYTLIEQTTIDNGAAGIILAGPGSSLRMRGGVDVMGGTLQTSNSSIVFTLGSNMLDGVANAVTNEGKVAINNGVSLEVQGAIVNRGSITDRATSLTTSLLVGMPGVTLSGGGQLTLTDNAFNLIEGVVSGATLKNVDNTISGAGSLGNGQMVLVNEAAGVIDATGSNALTIDTGASVVVNAGTIEAVGQGGLTIDGRVRNTGLLSVALGTLHVIGAVAGGGSARISGGTLDFTGVFSQAVSFTGSEGVLEMARAPTYHGTISGFSTGGGTSLDLDDIAFIGAGEATFSGTASGGVLTVTDGTHTANINLKGNFLGSTFAASSDGHGGTSVVAHTADGPTAPLHAFISAMAGFGHSPASQTHAGEAWSAREPMLTMPRVAIA